VTDGGAERKRKATGPTAGNIAGKGRHAEGEAGKCGSPKQPNGADVQTSKIAPVSCKDYRQSRQLLKRMRQPKSLAHGGRGSFRGAHRAPACGGRRPRRLLLPAHIQFLLEHADAAPAYAEDQGFMWHFGWKLD